MSEAEYALHPVGAGPFVLDEFVSGSRSVFSVNKRYWDYPKRPQLQKLTIGINFDGEARFNTLQSGGAQAISWSESPEIFARAESAGLQSLRTASPVGSRIVVFNTTKAPFNDLRARRAIVQAWNQKNLVDTVFGGQEQVVDSLFLKGSPFYTGKYKQQAYNPKAAQKLFDELASEGKPLEFTFSAVPVYQPVAEWFQAQLTRFKNVKMSIDPIPVSSILQRAQAKDFQFLSFASNGFDPDQAYYTNFLSTSPTNYSGWNVPAADQALIDGRSSTEFAARKEAYTQFEKVFFENNPVLVAFAGTAGLMLEKGITFKPAGSPGAPGLLWQSVVMRKK
jgi:peptide/nickel transport system substrate-binding protein